MLTWTLRLLLLVACAFHGTAMRVNVQMAKDAQDAEASSQNTVADPYWVTHKGSWNLIGLVHDTHMQKFEMKEDHRLFKTTKYDFKLKELEDDNGAETKVKKKVLRVTNDFFTMHGHQTVEFQTDNIGDYTMYNPRVISRHYTWRVAKLDDPDKVLFTIQKRLYNDHCKFAGLFSCKPILKIYVGHRGDKSTLIYYGVGDKDLDEPDFKFYHSKESYESDKKKWVAKIDHKKHDHGDGEDKYKIKVKPGEDAGLILLAATCLDKIGDDARQPEYDDHDHHDFYGDDD